MAAAARGTTAQQTATAAQQTGVAVDVVAGLFGLTPRRIQQLAKEGVLPKAERGRYNLAACVRSYVAHLQAKLQEAQNRQVGERSAGLAEDKALKVRAERELAELRVQRERSMVVPVADVAADREREYAAFSATLDAIPSREAATFPEVPVAVAIDRLHGIVGRAKLGLREVVAQLQDAAA